LPVHILPYREIAATIAERLLEGRGDPLGPWAFEVVVPSRGMAEAIAAEVVAREPRGVAGLRIRFPDGLARAIVNDAGQWPRVATDAERRLAMRMAVRAIEHPIMDGRGVASMIERSYRDLRDSGLRVAGLPTRGLRNPHRTQAILRAFAEYERLIAQCGAIDPADLLSMAERAMRGVRPQLIAGFYDMTGAQLSFVRALMPFVESVFVPSALPFARPFLESVGGGVPATTRMDPAGRATEHAQRDDELRAVCAEIASLLARGETSVGIAARSLDPYDVRLLNRFAAEHGFRTTTAGETPLAAHRIGRGAITLLRLRDRGFQRGEVLELLRNGLQTRTRISVDRADYETRRARVAGGTHEELAPLRNRSGPLDDYIALVAELEELTGALEFDRLSTLFRVESELDLTAAEKLEELAATFRRLRSNDASSFIDAIEHESLPCDTPTAGGAVVWLGDVMRFRGRSFEHLFVIRMQDDVFPQRRTEDPLFPDADRRILGMREIGDGREEEELLLALLRESAANVQFSFAGSDGFGKVLRPSRYVRGLPLERRISARREDAGGLQAAAPAGRRQLQLLAKSGTRSVFDGYIAPVALARALSPTQLEDFGECPQKFLLKHVLGVEDVEHPEREVQINHRDKGTIDHRILERFYRSSSEDELARAAAALPRLPDEIVARLERIIDEQFDEHERLVPPFNRTVRAIERRATKRILCEFVAADLADLAANELVPRHFEYRFGFKHRGEADHPEPFVVEAGGVPVRVEGTIDRIDAGGARLRIVDYKSGKALRHKDLPEKIDRGVRLQLALYAMAAAEFFQADAAQVSGTIKPLVSGDKAKFAFELQEKREGLLETLEIFAGAIAKGVFPAFPMDDDFNSCKYCPVNHSCRTRHDQEERYAIQQQRDPRTLLRGGGA
jgi:RecB family exonuclease